MTKRGDRDERNTDAAANAASALSRRSFLKGAGGVAAAGGILRSEVSAARAQDEAESGIDGELEVRFRLNGAGTVVKVEPRTTLLSALRHHLAEPATGTKAVCDQGNCGACTVLLDDEPVYACLTLAVQVEGRSVRTVEGVAGADGLSTLQDEMWTSDGLMCGYCTPGFVMSLTAVLERNPDADEAELRGACAGNLCRCGTYTQVFEAGLAAARKGTGESEESR